MDKQSVFTALQDSYSTAALTKGADRVSVGHAGLNTALGGGLLCQRVHLVTNPQTSSYNQELDNNALGAKSAIGQSGAGFGQMPTAFTLSLIALLQAKHKGPIVWCGPVRSGLAGHLFGAGLAEMGLSPAQFIFVRESHPLRRMAAFEEALATHGLSAVVNEYGPLYEKPALWQKSARRLQLACARGTATAFMVGTGGAAAGFETAWQVAPASQPCQITTDWRPAWQVTLTHARSGYPAAATLLWDKESGRLLPAQPLMDQGASSDDWVPDNWKSHPYRTDIVTPIWRKTG
ncbi:MAG: ImuA family protein [Candidatus Puniceispirillaceae bacterium]